MTSTKKALILTDLQSAIKEENWQKSKELCELLHLQTNPNPKVEISIVAPVYNESSGLREFYNRLVVQLEAIGRSYEVILVDDGSDSSTKGVLHEISKSDDNIAVIELSRNFGHQMAISAGLNHAQGELVIIMDSDLQDPPEVLPQFLSTLNEGYDIVYGIRRTRKENFVKKFCYASFYRILKLLSSIDIPVDAGDFCIMRSEVVSHLKELPERNRFLRGLRSWVGYKQTGIEYDRDQRYRGKPKYTISRLIQLAFDGIFSFSYRPLRAISLLGACISLAAFALALFYTIKRIQIGLNPPGFASTMVAIFFFAGLQLVTLGVIGEYVGRVYEEAKKRPHYIIQKTNKPLKS